MRPLSKRCRRARRAGLTLIEILVAVSLLGLLAVGLLTALQVGVGAWQSAEERLSLDRRIATANSLLHSIVTAMVPVVAEAPPDSGRVVPRAPFFQGEPRSMRFVSAFSLTQGLRGGLHITELQVTSGPRGQRVLLNQAPYRGPYSVGRFIEGYAPAGGNGRRRLAFAPIQPSRGSLIVADQLDDAQFFYLRPPGTPQEPAEWVPVWDEIQQSPLAVRISLSPQQPGEPRLLPVTITARTRARYVPDAVLPFGPPTGFANSPQGPPQNFGGQMVPRRPYAP